MRLEQVRRLSRLAPGTLASPTVGKVLGGMLPCARVVAIIVAVVIATAAAGRAEDAPPSAADNSAELAKKLQNPVADLIRVAQAAAPLNPR